MHGNFGLALYTYITLNKVEFSVMNADKKWLDAFFRHYFLVISDVEDVIYKQSKSNLELRRLSQTNIKNLLEFESKYSNLIKLDVFNCIPNLCDIKNIVNKGFYSSVDSFGIKVMLDLWENALRLKNISNPMLKDIDIDGSSMDMNSAYIMISQIYNQLKDEQIEKIHSKISMMKESFYFVLVNESKIVNLNNKKEYAAYYKSKITALESKTLGLDKNDLIL